MDCAMYVWQTIAFCPGFTDAYRFFCRVGDRGEIVPGMRTKGARVDPPPRRSLKLGLDGHFLKHSNSYSLLVPIFALGAYSVYTVKHFNSVGSEPPPLPVAEKPPRAHPLKN